MLTLNSLPHTALSVGLLEVNQQHAFADGSVHRKTAPCTIIAQALEGRYEVISNGTRVLAEEGEAFLATDGQPLEITHHARRRGGLMKARWLHVRFLLFTSLDFASLLTLPGKATGPSSRQFGQIICELLRLQAQKAAPLSALARRNELAFAALRLLCEIAPISPSGLAFINEAERLAPVLRHIREHLCQGQSIAALARVAHLSRSRFHAYFRRHMRLSPMDYVKSVRLAQARQLLITTDTSIKQIAGATGFANPYHFSREFKNKTGLAPFEYRRAHRELQV